MNNERDEVDTRVCEAVTARITRLFQLRNAGKIVDEEFSENALHIMIHAGSQCWSSVVYLLSPDIRSLLHLYCNRNIDDDYVPHAESFLPGGVTDGELIAKRSELRKQYLQLARVIGMSSGSTLA